MNSCAPGVDLCFVLYFTCLWMGVQRGLFSAGSFVSPDYFESSDVSKVEMSQAALLFFRMNSAETFSNQCQGHLCLFVSRPLFHVVHPTVSAAGGSWCTPATGSVWVGVCA